MVNDARSSWIQWHFAGVCVYSREEWIQLMAKPATADEGWMRRTYKFRICDILSWAMIECSNTFSLRFSFFSSLSHVTAESWRDSDVQLRARLLVLCVHFIYFSAGPGRRSIVRHNPAVGFQVYPFSLLDIFTFSGCEEFHPLYSWLDSPRGQWSLLQTDLLHAHATHDKL